MPRLEADPALSDSLAKNMKFLRQRRELTQARLAALAGVPRPTLALIETGTANPTLAVLARLSAALQVSLDELVTAPRSDCQLFKKGSLPSKRRASGKALVAQLLPDPIPGLDIERIELLAGARMTGSPHTPGTREYLACERGTIELFTAGEKIVLGAGDMVAFRGDQPHSYANSKKSVAVGYSVIAMAPATAVRRAPGAR